MTWIRLVAPEEAEGKLKALYRVAARHNKGVVGPVVRLGSLNPDALEARMGLFRALMYGSSSPLSRAEREMIAVVTSTANDCHY